MRRPVGTVCGLFGNFDRGRSGLVKPASTSSPASHSPRPVSVLDHPIPGLIRHPALEALAQEKKKEEEFLSLKLIKAAMRGDLKKVRFYVEAEANLNAKSMATGRSALHEAVLHDRYQVINCLVRNGADIYASDRQGNIPLHCAVLRMNRTSIIMLITIMNKLDILNKQGKSPLRIALDKRGRRVISLLEIRALELAMQYGKINNVDMDGFTPLHFAVAQRKFNEIEFLQANGSDINAKDANGSTVLHYAALRSDEEMVKRLLRHNPNILTKDGNRLTAAELAARKGNFRLGSLIRDYKPKADEEKPEQDWEPVNLVEMSEDDQFAAAIEASKKDSNRDSEGSGYLSTDEEEDAEKPEEAVNSVVNEKPEDDDSNEPPDELCCSITGDLFQDPVVNSAGQTYERKWIENWYKKNNTDPNSNAEVESKVLFPNVAIRGQCREWLEKHPDYELDGSEDANQSAPGV